MFKYGVAFSGHGSRFTDVSKFEYTFEEANKIALEWELRADTIGGKSNIIREDGKEYDIVE